MGQEYLRFAQQAIMLVVLISGPPVLGAMFVGLSVALFQALTQVQEQTLSMVGRIVAIFGIVMLLGYWMAGLVLRFAITIFESFPQIVAGGT